MSNLMKSLIGGEEGATMVEYALMVALIAAALIVVVQGLSSAIGGNFSTVGTTISGS